MTRSLMVVGTSSNVGKSVLATALCRILTQDGYRVAPFKAQNMSLNSAVTPSGREIGRAQSVQAEACGILSSEHMNPVLLKPTGSMQSQVVLQGRPIGTRSGRDYFVSNKDDLWQAVVDSYQYLAERYEVIVIEGAGSPVEMNLKTRDIANMRTAQMADAGVLLVADIDRGGVFASVVGTLQLLSPDERKRVKGIIINKFLGDICLFDEGREWLESYTGVPVLGVIPFMANLDIDEEDSVSLSSDRYHREFSGGSEGLRVAIVRLPYISNFTDVDPLFLESSVYPYLCESPEAIADADVIVLPGTKSTICDLLWLHQNGWTESIMQAVDRGAHVLGICGGYQMLGEEVRDPQHIESDLDACEGLGFFHAVTTIGPEKQTVLVEGTFLGVYEHIPLAGYEIHMGTTQFQTMQNALAVTRDLHVEAAQESDEGHVSSNGRVIGTYLHGILHNDEFRAAWLNKIRDDKGMPTEAAHTVVSERRADEYNRLADTVRRHLDMERVYEVVRG